ncbi:MAG TPA: LytTR family DNA-binding domain-containing protein [Thermoanaerobaculia bacterium]
MTKKLRALIVDDERLARQKVRTFLATRDDVETAAEAANVEEAAAVLAGEAIDLLFLDIQMPGGDGFDLLRRVEKPPAIIFVTAHDEYAVRAFDVAAVDYLLKPYDRQRFDQAIERAKAATDPERVRDLIEAWDTVRRGSLEHFLARKRDRMYLIPVKEVDWIEAEGKYIRVHTKEASFLIRDAITAVEARLDPRQFVRIHRSTIVNLNRIGELQRGFGGDVVVLLQNGTRLTLSRRFRAKVREITGLDI